MMLDMLLGFARWPLSGIVLTKLIASAFYRLGCSRTPSFALFTIESLLGGARGLVYIIVLIALKLPRLNCVFFLSCMHADPVCAQLHDVAARVMICRNGIK